MTTATFLRRAAAIPLVATMALWAPAARADSLDAIRHEVRSGNSSHDNSNDSSDSTSDHDGDHGHHHHHHHHGHHDEDSGGSDNDAVDSGFWSDPAAAFLAVFYVVTSPWTLPYMLVEPDSPYHYKYADYPFADGADGALLVHPAIATQAGGSREPGNAYALQLSFDGAYQWQHLGRLGVTARLQLPARLELDTSWAGYGEPQPHHTLDMLAIGTAHVSWRFAQNPNAQFRTGLGYRQLTDAKGSNFGVDVFYGCDFFFAHGGVLSIEAHLGSLGHAWVEELRGTLGMTFNAAEIYMGYQQLFVGNASMGGILIGTRLWL